jgi:succinate dehydrogenase / fumarate reductase flavoprotein subunit
MQEVREGRGIDGSDYVHLDLTSLGEDKIKERLWEIASFARIYAGVDPVHEPIPVQPTCHYIMGGIATDVDARVLGSLASVPVPGLFAAGECACVSVHGANRLGCNSLLDLVVFGRRAGKAIRLWLEEKGSRGDTPDGADYGETLLEQLQNAHGEERIPVIRQELQQVMMEHCSVFRNEQGLQQAKAKIGELEDRYGKIGLKVRQRYFNQELIEAIECGHLLDLAAVMVESALLRKESRGAHYREDYPTRDDQHYLCHTLAFKDKSGIRIEYKPVKITQFKPVERRY